MHILFFGANTPRRCILFLCHALGDPAEGTVGPPPPDLPFDSNKQSTKHPTVVNRGVAGKYRLIVASNRDEDLGRPTEPLHFWADTKSNLLAGKFIYFRKNKQKATVVSWL